MSVFHFKEFAIQQTYSAMKVGTDAMLLGAFVDVNLKTNALDIGTGTGVVALMLAQKNSDLSITAIEIDAPSADEARLNFENSPWKDRLHLQNEDFLNYKSKGNFDLIVTNPPYFENGLLNPSERKAVTRHEAALPLQLLFEKVKTMLTDSGHFWIILPVENEGKWKEKALQIGLYCIQEIIVFGKPSNAKRVIFCFSLINAPTKFLKLLIRNEDKTYSEEYKVLTFDFHGVKL